MPHQRITLKYGSTQMEFKPIVCDDVNVTNRKTGRLLNGVAYSHLTASWREWDIVISADELYVLSKVEFIRAFWKAKQKRELKIGTGAWIEVITDGGSEPVENIEGSKFLPEYKLRLIEVQGGVE